MREGLAEAIWGEVLQRELPFGSNRVLAVIMTDLSIGAFGESRALIVRENSLRPAHFIRTEKGKDFFPAREDRRITKLTTKLRKFVLSFIPEEYGTESERFVLGQKILVHRITQKFAAEYTHSVFHGSTSPSNIDLRGTALDLGPMTALSGFEQALFADDYPNGDTRNIKETILFEFFDDLKQTMPEPLKKSVLSRRAVGSIINSVFEENVKKEFLWFVGTPREILDQVWERSESQVFAKHLWDLAKQGNDNLVNVRFKVGKDPGTYNVRNIMKNLVLDSQASEKDFLSSLNEEIPDEKMRNKILKSFSKFQLVLTEVALNSGYGKYAFKKYQSSAVEIRNKKMTTLMRGTRYFIQFFTEIWKYRIANNRSTLFNFVNRIIDSNRREWFSSTPKTLVIGEKKHYESGAVLQQVVDGVTGEERIELVAPVVNNVLVFFDKKISLDGLRSHKMSLVLGENSFSISSVKLLDNKAILKFNTSSKTLNTQSLSTYSRVSFVESKKEAKISLEFNTPEIKEDIALDERIEKQIDDYKNQQEQLIINYTRFACESVFLSQ